MRLESVIPDRKICDFVNDTLASGRCRIVGHPDPDNEQCGYDEFDMDLPDGSRLSGTYRWESEDFLTLEHSTN